MPARFLRAVTFEGLERHVFEDDRAANPAHPFNDPRYAGASILVVNRNFGCGSSREHAPQGLARFGIQGDRRRIVLGDFPGQLGDARPALLRRRPGVDRRAAVADRATPDDDRSTPTSTTGIVTAGALTIQAHAAAGVRDAFLSGQWNPTAMLLDDFEQVRAVAARLPYVSGF